MRFRFTPFLALFFFVTFLMSKHLMAQPNVHILTTGGTIASVNGAPMIDGPQLVQAVPQLLDYADINVEEFSKIGSSKMTPTNWLQLARRINELVKEKPELSGIVITHGTDSMEETAFFLNLTVKTDIPVVIVGSMRSSNEISADGPANLLNAVRVSISKEAKNKGVLVVLNENISAGRDLLKINNRRVETFKAHELGYLGFADPDTVIFYRAPLKPHTFNTEFDISNLEELPQVDIIQDFAGFDPEILELIGQRDIDGLVISSFAGGRMSYGMLEGLEKLKEKNIPIVIASSIQQGRIIGHPYQERGWIIAPDLPANKARVLLMLSLTKANNKKEIQDFFNNY
jgi:L-asparaginase